ncbi:LytR/AlgR family response regulator transcription factor [Anaerorhabdus furcosa]|uniref:Two component transcriptional regulator, LytTR family n=1 Tax=Anaerorhabdus furcosa TaxID=118967 RepID=A0A1T4NNZ3_9FIRM|nr:LytTR family DNA-binding domain-containing protein [Anaerorhabdus furcosa]SJZ80902.1 two component transcriptional regulator, LytTR family [Anaerorhabdus furcosa]
MIKIAIVDDNPFDTKWIINCLEKLDCANECEITCFSDGQDLIDAYKNDQRFDILLLDMLMEKVNGLDTAKFVRTFDQDVEILIITSTLEYAVEGYTVNARRYYLKPLKQDEFLKEINTIIQNLKKNDSLTLSIHNSQGVTKIKLNEIYYIESLTRTLTIHTQTSQIAMIGKISEMEESLSNYGFMRVHKSFIVNLKYIKNIFKDVITLDNNDTILLSKHKSKQVHDALMEYIQNR